MRIVRTVTLLLLLVLVAPLTGGVGTASAAEATKITISEKPKVGVFYDEVGPKSTPDVVRHQGFLTTAGGAPIANAPVVLERELAGGGMGYLEETTNAKGKYTFFSAIHGNATYRAIYTGDATYDPATSGPVKIKAMRDFNAGLVKKKGYVLFKGNINPEWNNKVVRWERKTCKSCKWQVVDQEKSGDTGAWSFRGNYPPLHKKWFYRASLDGTKEFVKSYSARLITTTKPARQPAARMVGR